jgi:hypothetical protein
MVSRRTIQHRRHRHLGQGSQHSGLRQPGRGLEHRLPHASRERKRPDRRAQRRTGPFQAVRTARQGVGAAGWNGARLLQGETARLGRGPIDAPTGEDASASGNRTRLAASGPLAAPPARFAARAVPGQTPYEGVTRPRTSCDASLESADSRPGGRGVLFASGWPRPRGGFFPGCDRSRRRRPRPGRPARHRGDGP